MATMIDPSVEEDLYQFLDNLPEKLKGTCKIDPSQVKKAYENAKDFKILVTGKTGSGKSTLINGILGVSLTEAEEGDSISKPGTPEVTHYHVKGNVDITIWDIPGLQDGTDNERYLRQMKEKCGERDLTMYCIDVQQKRFLSGGDDNPDVVAMKKLTREFGPQFWNNTVIVLTFFNYVADNIHIKYLKTREEKIKAVEAKLQEWKDQIVKLLVGDMDVDQEFAEKILIVPAGYYRESHLPVRKYWLSNLWFHCFAAVSTEQGQLALLKTNLNRMKRDTDVQVANFEKPIEQQPIVYEEKHVKTVVAVAKAVAGTVGCGLVGSVIGSIGGPPGIMFGLVAGVCTGALVLSRLNDKK